MNTTSQVSLTRRQVLTGAIGVGVGLALARSRRPAAAEAAVVASGPRHLVWVWQFSTDAEPPFIAQKLRDNGLGIVLKTHDGLQWMSEYDKSHFAVSGPAQIKVLANYYENEGVPFHAWAVVRGVDVKKEAQMAADVLGNGARSLFLDIEPYSGFWQGGPAEALAYGAELRRLQPDAKVVLSIDPRPWIVQRLPMKEFASFANEIAPQQYWRTFDTSANYTKFAESGFPVQGNVTPEFLINVANVVLGGFGLPLTQVGQGATPDAGEFRRFVDSAYGSAPNQATNFVTVWRYGVTNNDIFSMLKDIPVKLPPVALQVKYTVQDGDTLGSIADNYGVSAEAIMAANNINDANYLYVGQELVIPGAAAIHATAASPAETSTSSEPAAEETSSSSDSGGSGSGGGQSYTVSDGDTLYGISNKFGTSADAIAKASGLTDMDALSIGQVLTIP